MEREIDNELMGYVAQIAAIQAVARRFEKPKKQAAINMERVLGNLCRQIDRKALTGATGLTRF